MESKGRLISIAKDYMSGKLLITFEIETSPVDELNSFKDLELSITAKKYKAKRSLDANAYFHVLVDKLADHYGISKVRCKNLMIARYGQAEMVDGEIVFLKSNIPIEKMMENEIMHCHPVRVVVENDKEVVFYKVYRGSHSYDTKEMSILINGVVDECSDAGIETISPEELARMVNSWRSR